MRFVTSMMVVLVGLMSVSAQACYTGLALIPTADVAQPGEYSIELQFDGTFARGNEETRILNTEFGLTPRLEAGIDYDFSRDAENRTLLNAKYVVLTPGEHRPALAVGICNMGQNLKSSPYAVGTRACGSARGHLGVVSIDGSGRWFAGVDKAVNMKLTLTADYTSGNENNSSIGLSYQFNDRSGITSGVVFPNECGDTQLTIHLVCSGSCRHTRVRR